jgi:hypothetical protein
VGLHKTVVLTSGFMGRHKEELAMRAHPCAVAA